MFQVAPDEARNDRNVILDRAIPTLRLLVLAIWMIACSAGLGAVLWWGS